MSLKMGEATNDGNTMNGRAENPQGGGSNFKFVRVK
jgi:hypothetical protein